MKLDNINHIGIVGTGMMASSLGVLTTGHGYRTTILTRSVESENRSRKMFDDYYLQMLDKKLVSKEQIDVCTRYANYTQDYADLADCDVVFECIVEELEAKHIVYRKIEQNCPGIKAICSVSSAILVDDMVKGVEKVGDRILVTHPFNPPHMVPFFEICTGASTSQEALDLTVGMLESLDRKPVVLKKPAIGFIGNRLQFALWREAVSLVESGIADPRDVDTCLMYSFCPRYTTIGIFEHFDNGGLELNRNVCKTVFPALSNEQDVPKSVSERIERGDIGPRGESHKGFYDWNGVDMDAFRERISEPFWKFFDWEMPKE